MYQNFNCCSSDWMERTKYIQGRSGTKSKDCLPFVQYYKCLENKTENENIQYFHLCSDFPSPCPSGKFLTGSHASFPLPSEPPKSFSLSKEFCSRPSQKSCCLSYCNIPTIFYSFSPYRVLCHHLHHKAGKRVESPSKIKNYTVTKMWWRDFYDVLFPNARDLTMLLLHFLYLDPFVDLSRCFLSHQVSSWHEAQLHSRI